MFAAADVCGIDRSLCIPGDLDLYDICCEPDLTDFVYFLSGIMDNYVFGAYGVLWDCTKAGREIRTRGNLGKAVGGKVGSVRSCLN